MRSDGWKVLATVVFIAVLVAGVYFWRKPNNGGNPQRLPTLAVDGSKGIDARRQAAHDCLDQALAQIRQASGDTAHDEEKRKLETRWVEYLQRIQAEQNYPNWPGKPCELYLRRTNQSVSQAVAAGIARIEVYGAGLDKVTVTVTVESRAPLPGGVLVVPVGTVFGSASGSTQNMIAAESVRFAFSSSSADLLVPRLQPDQAGGVLRPAVFDSGQRARLQRASTREALPPQTVTQPVPAYCINRWLHVPKEEDRFTVSGPDANSPVAKLVSCLETSPVKHRAKQEAVWMVSDDLMSMSAQTLAEKLFTNFEQEAPRDSAEFMVYVAVAVGADPRKIPDEMVDEARRQPRDEFERERRAFLWKLALLHVKAFKETAPLLQSCGFDPANKAFFQSDLSEHANPPPPR